MTRGGILAGIAAIALLAGVAVLVGGPVASAQSKKEVPLETKGDASERPWKRYAGWPTREYSKYNTLGNLVTAPASKERRKITGQITGEAANGEKVIDYRDRRGSCLGCAVVGLAGRELF